MIAATATQFRFRAEQRAPADIPYNSIMKHRVDIDAAGHYVETVTLRATLADAQAHAEKLNACQGCGIEAVDRKSPSHEGSIWCSVSIRGGGVLQHCKCETCAPWGAK